VAAIASSLKALAAMLPPAKSAAEWAAIRRYDGAPAEPSRAGGAPLWWVRKLPR
jgi:hypothetical protein